MDNKLMSLEQAVARIPDGASVAFGGMLNYRRPVAAALEIGRQQKQSLTLMGWTLSIESDLLIALNCVSCVRTSFFSFEIFGLAPSYRSAVEAGRIRVVEETESTIGFGLRAAMQDVGFMPVRSLLGTDLLKVRKDIVVVKCPYSQEEYPAVPAWRPEVAIIHAVEADYHGNAHLASNVCVDVELAQVADYTILTAERVVAPEEFTREGTIVGSAVDAVVEVPAGCWPTSCYPVYGVDGWGFLSYLEAVENQNLSDYIESMAKRFGMG